MTYARSLGIEVEQADLGRACGVSLKGKILFSGDGHVPRTLAHEIVHEMVSVMEARPMTEILTDAAAHVVCLHFGVDPGPSTANYIVLWKGKADDILENMEFIRHVAHSVITGVTSVLVSKKLQSSPMPNVPALSPEPTPTTSQGDDKSTRTLKVYPFYTRKWPPDPHSTIRLQGKWVRDAGFLAGDPIVVEVSQGELLIKKGAS